MTNHKPFKIGPILLIGDVIAINAGFLFTYWLRFNSGAFPIIYGTPHVSHYFPVFPFLTIIMLFIMRSENLYSAKARLSIVDEGFLIIRTVVIGIFIFMAATFVYREYSFSRGMLMLSWPVLVIFLGIWRFIANRAQFFVRKKIGKTRNLLIVGDDLMVGRIIDHIASDPHWDYNVKGIMRAEEPPGTSSAGVPILDGTQGLGRLIDSYDIDSVILTRSDLPRARILEMILECEKRLVEFRLVADLLGMVTNQVDMRSIDGVPLLGLKESPLADSFNRAVKRTLDICFSALGIFFLSPLLVVIAVLVKRGSSGPVLYLQERIGEDGRLFKMMKFRTMVADAEKETGPVWAKENDPRRTGIGAFLRKSNIDELPQLFNVLKGEMSLVGPRPERPHFVEKFKEDIPRYMARHKIRSGMTGWAQVNGLRGNTSIQERTKYDLYYIENWSLAFDLKILLMSVFAMKNAY
ncbi:MAG: undecaprenyl-phosphate glucose phosphotransferase [Candidatus Omnitrophica bacterium]|nr:undecaprenyl-phosphate glucose phosphotransferase [Candidatus Omnitrophota bacterium]